LLGEQRFGGVEDGLHALDSAALHHGGASRLLTD
jgi:hypothetical protein